MDKQFNDLEILEHFGENSGEYYDAVVPPVFLTSLHVSESFEEYVNKTEGKGYVYGRESNPTVDMLEKKIAALERGNKAVVFSSGMGAFSSAVMSVCKTGDHIIYMRNIYGPAQAFLKNICSVQLGMQITAVEGTDIEELKTAIQDNTRMILLESPSTFLFKVVDIKAIADLAKEKGIITYIDNTYCTPLYQKPLEMGITLVMHTISKYLGGHSDLIGGVLVSRDVELMERIQKHIREWYGSILGPMEGWLALRGMRTLAVRLKQHQDTAMQIAQFLEGHPKVKRVIYTGLKSHPQSKLILKQQQGHTGLLSFWVKGNAENGIKLINELKIFKIGCSWGGFESLALCPVYKLPNEELEELGIREEEKGLIRIHCGLEEAQLLIHDLGQALEKLAV